MGVVQLLYASHPSWIEQQASVAVSDFSAAVIRRYYTIKRLEDSVNFIHHIAESFKERHQACLHNIHNLDVHHPIVQDVTEQISTHGSLDPFFMLWEDICAYKHVTDYALLRDIKRILCGLFHCFKQARLIGLDCWDIELEVLESVPVEAILFRYYFLRKVRHLIDCFESTSPVFTHAGLVINMEILFSHPVILECVRAMFKEKNTRPLLLLFNHIKKYDYIDDQLIYKDLLRLIFFAIQLARNPHDRVEGYEREGQSECARLDTTTIDTSAKELIQAELGLDVSLFIELMLRRFYLIKRLSFSSPQRTSLRPLSREWLHFKQYKNLSSQLLIDSYAQEIFILMPESGLSDLEGLVAHSLLPCHTLSSDSLFDVKSFAHHEEVVFRLYSINRIKRHIRKLEAYQKIPCILPDECINAVEHSAIKACVQSIQRLKRSDAFFDEYRRLKAYFYLGDVQYVYDFCIVLFSLMAIFSQQSSTSTATTTAAYDIHALFDHIDTFSFPLIDVLEKKEHDVGWWGLLFGRNS